ncbi:MAG: hypothetical protein C0413_04165 [Clostridiales bacterium]|nr:hypothetical protein [Clostridiales bacterium]
MFGYIRPLECELKVREQAEYRGVYCGLCKSIGRRYGQLERLTLSYDCAFLALTLFAISGTSTFTPGNCGPRIYRGKRPIANPSPVLDYAADVNVLLAWYKAADDAADEKSAKAAAARLALKRAYKKAAKANPQLDVAIRGSMQKLHDLETNKTASTDEPSNAFGTLLASVILTAPMLPETECTAAQWMYYNLGKWVYLIDAWDDREKDEKSGNYNPFLLTKMEREQAEFLLNITLNEAKKAYDLLTLNAPSGLLDNIMTLGLMHTQQRVLAGERGCATGATTAQKEKGDKE